MSESPASCYILRHPRRNGRSCWRRKHRRLEIPMASSTASHRAHRRDGRVLRLPHDRRGGTLVSHYTNQRPCTGPPHPCLRLLLRLDGHAAAAGAALAAEDFIDVYVERRQTWTPLQEMLREMRWLGGSVDSTSRLTRRKSSTILATCPPLHRPVRPDAPVPPRPRPAAAVDLDLPRCWRELRMVCRADASNRVRRARHRPGPAWT